MVMLSPLDLDLRVAWHREELLGEAAAERLAAQVRESRPGVRPRLAAALQLNGEYAARNPGDP